MDDDDQQPHVEGAGAGAGGADTANNDELAALREKLQVMQQIQQLQLQLGGGFLQPSRPAAQPAMRIKPPEGLYSMSRGDFRTRRMSKHTKD